jgi:O-antigen ligase
MMPTSQFAPRPVTTERIGPEGEPPVERGDWSYWGVFLFTALLFFRPQDAVPALSLLHLSDIVGVLTLLAMIANRSARGLTPFPLSPEVIGVGALGLVMVLTVPFSIWPGGALAKFTDLYLKVALIFVVLLHCLKGPKLLRQFTWLIVIAMGYVAFRGVFDYVRGINLIQGGRLHGPDAGLMGNPNDLAMNMVTFLPLAVFLALSRGRSLPRLIAAVVAVAMFATIIFTKSRGGMLGLAVMGLVLLLQARKVRPGLAVAIVVGALVVTPLLPSYVWTRASSIFNQDEDATGTRQARKDLMYEAWRTFLERPVTGLGAGQFTSYNPPGRLEPWRETHNVMLQMLVELGILGGLAFLYLLVRAVAALVWTSRRLSVPRWRLGAHGTNASTIVDRAFRSEERERMRLHVSAMSAGFAGWITCAQFASIGYSWTFYYLFALILAARHITANRLEATHRSAQVEGPA